MPVTENLQSDIISLSSYLHSVKDSSYRSERHNSATTAGLTLFNNVATLLATTTNGVYDSTAVLGSVEPSGVNCFVLATQQGPDQDTTEGSDNPQVVPVTPDATNGRKLLDAWSSQQCDVSIIKHIQEVFDIITCIQHSENPSRDLLNFLFFTYIRTFRVLASRVLDLQRHWRIAPFCLVQEHIADIIERPDLKKRFYLQVDEMQRRLLSKFDLTGDETSHKSHSSHRPDWLYSVDPANVHLWIRMLVGLYQMLEVEILLPKSSSGAYDGNSQSDAIPEAAWPPADKISLICLYIGTLYVLKPIQRHILSVLRNRKLVRVFEEAELEQVDGHQANEYNDNAVGRVIRAIDGITAWHSSVIYVSSIMRNLAKAQRSVRLYNLQYTVASTVHCDIARVEQVLKSINPQREWNNSDIESLHKTAMSAVVHPEAALMAWASSPASHAFLNVSQPLTIGVSHGCCRSCWLFQRVLNSDELSANFVLPESQLRFESWIPPPDIPDRVLLALRDRMLQMTRPDSTRPDRPFHLIPRMFAWLDSNTTFKEAMAA
ncbi:hypothetical protein GYMLUDRAFT_73464 [Collybiopsis luxurians FD-317 M1]|uniref:Uncharacterized protein n=1 Tax=Collybiopsis luxurians FD-317 M1 TaxID=944289 RepID=A0A0D0CEQ1_9AGAR|nr:hypothetical protein GYMLUDRAFT_73464 [Collybiopsis luxurians FD-317 M1]